MDIKTIFAIASALVGVYAFFPYIRDIFSLKTKPHTYTWLVWAITQGTAVAGLIYGGGGIASLWLIVALLFVVVIFIFSLKRGTKNITKFDTLVLIAALSAIVVWWQLDNPLAAVLMVSAIDLLGYIPSLRKTFVNPWSETMSSWIAFSVADALSIFALTEYNLLTTPYLAAFTFGSILMLAVILVRRPVVPRVNRF